MPDLCCGIVAVPKLESCTVACSAVGDVEAASRLRVHEAALLTPAPLLGASTIAVPELDLRPVGSTAAGDVHASVENTQRPVVAVPSPALRASGVARPNLNCGAIVRAGTGVVDAVAPTSQDRPGAPVLRLNHRRRVEVVARVD